MRGERQHHRHGGRTLPDLRLHVEPTSAFSLLIALNALAMPLIGGTARGSAPVLGAILLGGAQQIATVTISSEVNILVVGLLLIAFVVAAPEGLLGLAAAVRERLLAREKRTERTA